MVDVEDEESATWALAALGAVMAFAWRFLGVVFEEIRGS
jgi:hypothetical protein